jgi:hypothetical protein
VTLWVGECGGMHAGRLGIDWDLPLVNGYLFGLPEANVRLPFGGTPRTLGVLFRLPEANVRLPFGGTPRTLGVLFCLPEANVRWLRHGAPDASDSWVFFSFAGGKCSMVTPRRTRRLGLVRLFYFPFTSEEAVLVSVALKGRALGDLAHSPTSSTPSAVAVAPLRLISISSLALWLAQ